MISTYEEFLLLLKKWKNESTQLSALAIFEETEWSTKGMFHIRGSIVSLDEAMATFSIAGEAASFATVTFAACTFIYEHDTDTEALSMLTGEQYDEMAIIVTPSKARVAVYTLKR
jgi:hypothetical protein